MWYEDQIDSLDEMRQLEPMVNREPPKPAPGLEQAEAAFELYNPITSWIVQEPLPNTPAVEGYNPMDDLEGYEKDFRAFESSRSPITTQTLKQRIDRERNNQKIIDEGDWVSTLSMIGAEVGNPFNAALMLLPGGALMTRGKPLVSALKSGGSGLVAAGISEATLHATQEARTMEETAINFAATALFDGVLGAAAGLLTKSERDVLLDQITEQITPLHAGAAQRQIASGAKMKETTAAFKWSGLGYIGQVMAKISPSGRLMQSQNQDIRATAQKLLETSFEVEGDVLPTAVETFIKLDRAKGQEQVLNVRNLQRQAQEKTGMDNATFSAELDHALRNGDIHEIPEVQAAARALRGEVDRLFNKAAELKIKGTFNEETGEVLKTNTAQSYWTRRHDLTKIRKNPEAYRQAWKRGLVDAMQAEGRAIPDDIDEIVSDIYLKVSKMNEGDVQGMAINPSVTKSRAPIKDEFLDEFLVKDWESLFESYMNSMSSRVRLAEAFGEGEGDFMMKGHIEGIRERFQSQHLKAQEAGNLKEADKIAKAMSKDIHDVEAMRDTLLGNYRNMKDIHPENRGIITALRTARSWNVATMLNSVLISSLPDVARVITAHGAKNYTKALARSVQSIGLESLPKDQLGKIASAADRATSMRLQQIADIDDGLPLSKAEQGARYVADKALTFSGLKHLNALNKTIVGIMSGDKIAVDVFKGGSKLTKRLGVDSDDVADQVKKYATKEEDGLYSLNTDRWDNHLAAEQVEAGIIKEADKIVLTPGVGDKPLLMSGEVAKTIFQFKNFIMAATNRLLIPLMQEQGGRKWVEIYSLMSMGAMSYYASALFAGREPSTDPAVILRESIDRAGLAAYGMEIFNTMNKVTGDPFGGSTRYRSRDWMGALLGPTAGTANELRKGFLNSQSNVDSRLHSMRKLAPLQNHFLMRRGIDHLEGEAAKALGGTGKYGKKKDRGKAVSF